MTPPEQLFVYGTLAPGRSNHDVIADITGTWQPATTHGQLLKEGRGAALGFPALIPSEDGSLVDGFLFSSPDLGSNWQMLDDFEGSGYNRVRITAHTRDGALVQAWVYALNENQD